MIESPARCLINAPLSNVRQLVYFLSYHAVVDNDKYDSGSHLRPALLSQIESEFAREKFHHALRLLKLKTKLFGPPTGAQECEDIWSLVVEIKGCLRSPRLSGLFWLLMDSIAVSNIADRSRVDSITNSCRRLSTGDFGFSTLELCGSNLLSEANSTQPEAMPDCGSADLPVRLAIALELMNRKRFVEAYGHLNIIANLSAPDIRPETDALFYLPAMTEFAKCCNILNKEHEGARSAQKALGHVTEAHHLVQVCSLRITLADAFIGQKEYARAKTTLEGILDGKCPSDYLRSITSLRLNKVDRRLGVLPTTCLSPGGQLGHIFLSPKSHHIPVDLMNECIDELASTCSSVRQRNNNNASTIVSDLAQIKSAIPVNINVTDNWRVLNVHEQITSMAPSPNHKHHEQSIGQTQTSAPLSPVDSGYPPHKHGTVHAIYSHPNSDIITNVENPPPNSHPGPILRLSQVDDLPWSGDPQQKQQLIHSQTILPQTHHVQPNENSPKLPYHLLPQPETSTEFFGRQNELRLIDQTFFPDTGTSSSSNLRSVVLSGLGGMGKTQIAIQYIHLYKHRFEAIFWLRGDNVNVLADGFTRVSRELGLEGEEDQNFTLNREKVKGWLSDPVRSFDKQSVQLDEVSWLLVFDNVNDMSVIQDYWPFKGHGSVLITSRSPLSDMKDYSMETKIELMPFNRLETINFIRSLTGASTAMHQQDDLQEGLEASARITDGLPVALIEMVGMVRRSDITLRDFVIAYDQSEQQLDDRKTNALDLEYISYLAAGWDFDRLSTNACFILQVISFLPANFIPEHLLTAGSHELRFNSWPPKDLGSYYEARDILIRSSLIGYNESRRKITVHSVVQNVTRRRMAFNKYGLMLDTAFALLSSAAPFQQSTERHTTSHWPAYAELLPSFLSLTEHLEKTMSVDVSARNYSSVLIAPLLNEFGWYGCL